MRDLPRLITGDSRGRERSLFSLMFVPQSSDSVVVMYAEFVRNPRDLQSLIPDHTAHEPDRKPKIDGFLLRCESDPPIFLQGPGRDPRMLHFQPLLHRLKIFFLSPFYRFPRFIGS